MSVFVLNAVAHALSIPSQDILLLAITSVVESRWHTELIRYNEPKVFY